MTPQRFDEFLIGTARQFSPALSGRAYFRYRKGTHYWEDTPNMSRILYNEGHTTVPGTSASIPQTPYISNLADQLAQIGIANGGNAYVIADLDGSFTDYRELTLESEYHKGHVWAQGSFTWSRYYGNFDQDGSSTAESNDANIYIGSSNTAPARAASCGTTSSATSAAIVRTWRRCWARTRSTGTGRSAPSSRRSRVSRGKRTVFCPTRR
jgi:hypothetical protein